MFDIYKYQKDLEQLCQQYNVQELSVFGSALRDDFDPERSDIDLVVTFKPMEPVPYKRAYFALWESLEALFERKVDLVVWQAVRNPYLRGSIAKTKETLYAIEG